MQWMQVIGFEDENKWEMYLATIFSFTKIKLGIYNRNIIPKVIC